MKCEPVSHLKAAVHHHKVTEMKKLLSILGWLNPFNYLFWVVDCTETTLNANSTCFQQLAEKERDAAIVWYLWQLYQTNGGTSDLDTLLQNAGCFINESPEMLHAMEVNIAYQAALAAGASVTGTLDEAVAGIACLKHLSPLKLRALKTALQCQEAAAVS